MIINDSFVYNSIICICQTILPAKIYWQ